MPKSTKVTAHDEASELAMLRQEFEALALENVRLATENMRMRNAQLANENMRLHMQGQRMSSAPPPFCPLMNDWTVQSNSNFQVYAKDQPAIIKTPWTIVDADVSSSGDSSFGTESTSAGSNPVGDSSFGDDSWETEAAEIKDVVRTGPSESLTTVMMRNIPNNMTREMLVDLLNAKGFADTYDFVYLPVDFKSFHGLGYSFINFVSSEVAERFMTHFSGFSSWSFQSDKVCEVTFTEGLQGVDAHVERYRNSPVMHESMPDDCKPMLFKNGERVPFPKPTKRIRAPRTSKKV